MKNNKIILDAMKFSFSSVNAYDTCPKMFYLKYLKGAAETDNAYAQWGRLVHKMYEIYFSSEITKKELIEKYIKMYNEYVTELFPFNLLHNISNSYFTKGIDAINNIPYIEDEVVATEQYFDIEIGGYPTIGYIDMILKDADNEYIIVDHKSRSKFKNKQERRNYFRQLYLYSAYIKQEFGKYPKTLKFNLFRENKIVEEPFDKDEYNKTIFWYTSTIDSIYNDSLFKDKFEMDENNGIDSYGLIRDDFFCKEICGVSRTHLHDLEQEKGW